MLTSPTAKKLSMNAQSGDERGSPSQSEAWHMLPLAEALERLQTDGERGLSQSEVTRRLAQYASTLFRKRGSVRC